MISKRMPAPKAGPRRASVPARMPTEAQLRRMPGSAYMNEAQLAFFRGRLEEMRQEVLQREAGARQRLHQSESHADPADRATAEEEYYLDMRLRERESRLLRKIEDSLRRIQSHEYGYCMQTGEAIGIPRLLIRPTASVCVDVKDREERRAGLHA